MKTFNTVLRCVGIVILAFIIIVLVNLAHDPLINTITAGHVKNHIPNGQVSELISLAVVFIAGFLAAMAVSLLAGKQRLLLLAILTVLFLAADLRAVLTDLTTTDLWYRILFVLLVPLEVWAGYRVIKNSGNNKRTI